jgi:hypothetical protein
MGPRGDLRTRSVCGESRPAACAAGGRGHLARSPRPPLRVATSYVDTSHAVSPLPALRTATLGHADRARRVSSARLGAVEVSSGGVHFARSRRLRPGRLHAEQCARPGDVRTSQDAARPSSAGPVQRRDAALVRPGRPPLAETAGRETSQSISVEPTWTGPSNAQDATE